MTKKSNSVNISEKQHQILLGLLLGDAHLELAENGKSARLKIEYSKEKLPYIEHVREVFLDWDPGLIRDAPGEKKDNWAFSTKYSTSLLEYQKRFYLGEKRIRCAAQKILAMILRIFLLPTFIWMMGGSNQKRLRVSL